MKNKIWNNIFSFLIGLLMVCFIIIIFLKYQNPTINQDICPNGDLSNSYYDGICEGSNITNTGQDINPISISGLYTKDMNSYFQQVDAGNYINFIFPNQPGHDVYDYHKDTEILNNYLKNNNKKFSLPQDTKTGYLYIKTRKPTTNIFMYWHLSDNGAGYPVSGNLDTEKSLFSGSSTEFLYKLDDVRVKYYFDRKARSYNRLKDILSRGETYIGGYVASFDGNKIEEIIIAYE